MENQNSISVNNTLAVRLAEAAIERGEHVQGEADRRKLVEEEEAARPSTGQIQWPSPERTLRDWLRLDLTAEWLFDNAGLLEKFSGALIAATKSAKHYGTRVSSLMGAQHGFHGRL